MEQYIRIQKIFKETSQGFINYDIQDKILAERKIDSIGLLSQENVNSIIL